MTFSLFASRCAPDPIVPHPAVPFPQLELRPTSRERLHSCCPWERLPNAAQPGDVPTPPRRVPPIAYFQVFFIPPFNNFLRGRRIPYSNSGDDHDYCEYIHTFAGEHVPEVTVKSLSIAMGIRQPGFQLLSLSSEARTHAHRPCSVPDQLHIYSWVYAPLIFATIVLVAVRAATAAAPSHHRKRSASSSLELPAYRAPVSRPPPAPPRKRRYLQRVMEDMWAIAWPPLAAYAVVAVTVSW